MIDGSSSLASASSSCDRGPRKKGGRGWNWRLELVVVIVVCKRDKQTMSIDGGGGEESRDSSRLLRYSCLVRRRSEMLIANCVFGLWITVGKYMCEPSCAHNSPKLDGSDMGTITCKF